MIVCGGDGSFRGAADLVKLGIPVFGIPCTIDNDMGYTDYTIGFDKNLVINMESKGFTVSVYKGVSDP